MRLARLCTRFASAYGDSVPHTVLGTLVPVDTDVLSAKSQKILRERPYSQKWLTVNTTQDIPNSPRPYSRLNPEKRHHQPMRWDKDVSQRSSAVPVLLKPT